MSVTRAFCGVRFAQASERHHRLTGSGGPRNACTQPTQQNNLRLPQGETFPSFAPRTSGAMRPSACGHSRVTNGKIIAMKAYSSGPAYSAPALEKGLDILELLVKVISHFPRRRSPVALGRSVSEIYRMLGCLVNRKYVSNIDELYSVTTKLFELSHINPPTYRLLTEAMPLIQELSDDVEQSCHLTIYNLGQQVVIAKVDSPIGMGWSLRVGAVLDVLISASGRVLVAFQDPETTRLRVKESIQRRPSMPLSTSRPFSGPCERVVSSSSRACSSMDCMP